MKVVSIIAVLFSLASVSSASTLFTDHASVKVNAGIPLLVQYRKELGITRGMLPLFFGQVRQETGSDYKLVESFNYSCKGLRTTYKKYRQSRMAYTHGRCNGRKAKERVIANTAYYKRNGNVHNNDGWKFRGRGGGHLTGRGNYKMVNDWITANLPKLGVDLDLVKYPEQVADPKYALITFAVYLKLRGGIPTQGSKRARVRTLTKSVTGGVRSANKRYYFTQQLYAKL